MSLKRTPEYQLIFSGTVDKTLANLSEGECVNCAGMETVCLRVVPGESTTVTTTIGFWGPDGTGAEGDGESALAAEPAISKESAVAYEMVVPVYGRKLAIGNEFTGSNGVKIYAAGFNWVDPS
jgi:hypothetical protein